MEKAYFDKKMTLKLKGMAIILMIIHHVLTFERNWPETFRPGDGLLWFASHFQSPTQTCVAIFAFLTGYFYFFNKNKTLQYSIHKIKHFMFLYWTVLFVFVIIYALTPEQFPPFREIVLSFLGLDKGIAEFNWYVVFYIVTMLLLPFVHKDVFRSKASIILLGMLLPEFIGKIFHFLFFDFPFFKALFGGLSHYLPVISTGVYCAKYDVFESVDESIRSISNSFVRTIFISVLWLAAFAFKYLCSEIVIGSITILGAPVSLCFYLDCFYSPIIIYCSVYLLKHVFVFDGFSILETVGKHSTAMWFFHCIFYNRHSHWINKTIYSLDRPVLILITVFLISLLGSYCVDLFVDRVIFANNRK